MGSFASTCCVSGLPIECGDEVRFFLLTENPYEDSLVCSSHDLYVPRTYPLRAKYNDYGSVEDVEEGPARDIWMEGLKIDLVEVGWGDNRCHDVPTYKDMSFDDLLTALWEDRVRVQREIKKLDFELVYPEVSERLRKDRVDIEPVIPEGVPTLQRVIQDIKDAGLDIFDGSKDGFMVDDECPGSIRVRYSSFGGGHLEELQKIEPILSSKYATMLTSGSGSYADECELICRPKPGVKQYRMREPDDKPLAVRQAMIREDVWNALVEVGLSYTPSYGPPLGSLYKQMQEEWGKGNKVMLDRPLKNHIPFSVGVATHWMLMEKRLNEAPGSLTSEQQENWLKTVAEFSIIESVLALTRYWWRPTYSVGPQFGEYPLHESVFSAFTKVAGDLAIKNKEEYE